MTTPQGPGPSHNPADPPAWGQQPAGGWGQPEAADAERAADDDRTQRVDPRTWQQEQPSQSAQGQPGQAQPVQGQPYGQAQPGQQYPPQPYPPQPYGVPPYGAPPQGPGSYGAAPYPPYGEQSYGAPQYGGPPSPQQQQYPGPPYPGQQPGQDAWARPGAPAWGQPPGGQPPGAQPGAQPTQQWAGQPDAGPWGQPGRPAYPPLPESPASSRSKLPLILGAVGVLVVAAVLVLGFVTPGFFVSKVFDTAAVQSGVQKVLTDDYGVQGVTAVTCPSNIPVAEGSVFTCDATRDGQPVQVQVHVTSKDGNYEVGRPA